MGLSKSPFNAILIPLALASFAEIPPVDEPIPSGKIQSIPLVVYLFVSKFLSVCARSPVELYLPLFSLSGFSGIGKSRTSPSKVIVVVP